MKLKVFLIVTLMINCEILYSKNISPKTLKEAESYTPGQLQAYFQSEYKLDDPAGDYALLKRSELVPMRILNSLTVKKAPKVDTEFPVSDEEYEIDAKNLIVPGMETESEKSGKPIDIYDKLNQYCDRHPNEARIYNQIYNSYGQSNPESMKKLLVGIANIGSQIQGRENPVLREGFEKMFSQIISDERENGIEPSYGSPHVWSKEFLDKHGKSSPMLISSKLLMALAVGETNRYMKTQKESELYDWLLTQKINSLEISDVFRASYKINGGDLYKTLLTIENVLAHQWRNNKREKLPFVLRLKPITSGHEYDQDKFGTWYHFFGIMLYGYVEGGLKAKVVGVTEALGSNMLSPGVDKTQKAWMNKQGGAIGGDLAKVVNNKSYLNHKSDPSYLRAESYLNKSEDFRDRVKVPVDSEIVATLSDNEDRTFIDIKDAKNRELKNCTIDMIPDMGQGFDARKKDTVKNVNLTNSLSTLQFFTPQVRRIRGFINCPGVSETIVFETRK